jgi:hypothetical protein
LPYGNEQINPGSGYLRPKKMGFTLPFFAVTCHMSQNSDKAAFAFTVMIKLTLARRTRAPKKWDLLESSVRNLKYFY